MQECKNVYRYVVNSFISVSREEETATKTNLQFGHSTELESAGAYYDKYKDLIFIFHLVGEDVSTQVN